jgi:enoyl-CoA hydratase/carnithine racemase
MADVRVSQDGPVGIAEICRPPHNYFDMALIRELADAFEAFDRDPQVRSVLLASEGKNFCAGANFANPARDTVGQAGGTHLYQEAVRLFRCAKPVVAAVQGAAAGGGLGLSLVADFRVASPGTRFMANFSRLGIHPGFGLSVTLPRAIGHQQAALLFYTGRRITGEEAKAIGLADLLVPDAELRQAALGLAAEIAQSAPIAVQSIRATLRQGLAEAIEAATARELAEQERHFQTEDFKEGVKATAERRPPVFSGR